MTGGTLKGVNVGLNPTEKTKASQFSHMNFLHHLDYIIDPDNNSYKEPKYLPR